MWKGARVTPTPWDDDDYEVERVPMQPPSNQDRAGGNNENSPKSGPSAEDRDNIQMSKNPKKEKAHKETKADKKHQKSDVAGAGEENKTPEFVYKSSRKKNTVENEELDAYLNRRLDSNHVWSPYLGERRQLLKSGPVKHGKGVRYSVSSNWRGFQTGWNEFLYMFEPWRGAIKKIEGHQGTGVVSFFVFLRWLFFLNMFIFLLMFWVVTFFQISFEPNTVYGTDLKGSDSTKFSTTNAETCSSQYSVNVSTDALSLILDFIQGTGWMEKTAMFNGYYTDKTVQLAVSSYNLPLAYFLVTVAVMLVSLIVMVRNTLSNFKDAVLAKETSSQASYCNMVFAGMDYAVDESEAMAFKQRSIYRAFAADLQEQRLRREHEQRTPAQKCGLYTVRFLINFLILAMLGGAGAAIYFAQDYSTAFTTASDVDTKYHALVILLVEFLPSIVIGLLNGIYPLIFDILVKFEKYTPAFVIKISLIRMVFLKLASLAMVVASLYTQITCTPQDTCLVGDGSCSKIQCWETYVGSAIYKLVVMDFLINAAMTLAVELPRKLLTTKCANSLLKKIGPASFDIPKNVLGLVYSQSLLWLGFYFAPLLPAVCIFTFFLVFYLKMLSAMYNTVPPEKPYQASKSNSFFTIILMIAFFLICIPVGYTLSNLDPSPMCGPFRIYNQPSDIIDVQISNAGSWFQTIWSIVTSAAVVSALLILLSLAIYYCSALNSAHKDLVEMMREQLVLEGKDKQFLMAKIAKLSGEPPKNKKPPPPYNSAQMKTVNETKPVTPSTQQMQNGDLGIEEKQAAKIEVLPVPQTEEIDLYGREKSIVVSPAKDLAPPPADYPYPDNTDVTVAPAVIAKTESPPVRQKEPSPARTAVFSPAGHVQPPPNRKVESSPVRQVITSPIPQKEAKKSRAPAPRDPSPPSDTQELQQGRGESPIFNTNKTRRRTPQVDLDEW